MTGKSDQHRGGLGGGGDPSTLSFVSARFAYACTYVPKRGRRQRFSHLTAKAIVQVRRLDPADKEGRRAFRLHFPERFTDHHFLREATLEVLWFEDKFWWPLTDDRMLAMYPSDVLDARGFLRDLNDGQTSSAFVLTRRFRRSRYVRDNYGQRKDSQSGAG